LRPTLWPALAAAALLLLLLDPATGHAATTSQRIAATAAAAGLDPSAGWHRRSVRRIVRTAPTTTRRAATTAWFDLRPGAGYATARGSAAVRTLQRHLRRLGYSPGPVDGRYGPRTRDAVGWFQLKHGLRVDGVAGPATQRRLQARVSGASIGARRPPAATEATNAPRPPKPSSSERVSTAPAAGGRPGASPNGAQGARPARSTDAASPSDRWVVAGLAVLAVLGILAAAGAAARLRRRRRGSAPQGTVIALARPLRVKGSSPDPAIGGFAGTAAALHVSPPTAGAEASPAIRYCVIDDETHTSVWVAAEDIQESRPVGDHEPARRSARGRGAARAGQRGPRAETR
jgi:hypothetical protein